MGTNRTTAQQDQTASMAFLGLVFGVTTVGYLLFGKFPVKVIAYLFWPTTPPRPPDMLYRFFEVH